MVVGRQVNFAIDLYVLLKAKTCSQLYEECVYGV